MVASRCPCRLALAASTKSSTSPSVRCSRVRSSAFAVSAAVEIRYCSFVRQRRCASKGTTASMRARRAVSIIAVLLLLAANAWALLPAASAFQPYLSGGALALGLVVLVTILAGRSPKGDTGSAAAEAARPVPVPTHASQADAE